MRTLAITHSTCGKCLRIVLAKVMTEGGQVYFQKFCPKHGESKHLVRNDPEDYLKTHRYVKPAWVPRKFAGDAGKTCPDSCGFCDRHEQHLCMPIVEITSRCDLNCPVCLVDAGRDWDMKRDELRDLLDQLIAAEKQIDVLNISGGEPLLHPDLLPFVDEIMSRPEIVRATISTNGLGFLKDRDLLKALHEKDVVVSLQLDGFSEKAYELLRGRPILNEKLQILKLLAEEGISTSLTMTAATGVNDDQLPSMINYLFSHDHVISMMIQPLAFTGRGARLNGKVERLTIPDIVKALGQSGHPAVSAKDFVPLPCSHPLCFTLSFYLVLDNGDIVAINRLTDAATFMDSLSNRVIFGLDAGEHERLKGMIYDLWSSPAGSVPDSAAVISTLRGLFREISCSCFDPRNAFTLMERRVKSIFIHAFQDAETFDLARVRRCCQAYPQPDGRLIPACVHNVLQRNGSSLGELDL